MTNNHLSLPEISEHTIQTWRRIRHDASAGGVAYRRVDAAEAGALRDPADSPPAAPVQIALIATRGGKRWQLPKGSREYNETPLQTAIREVHEEAGLVTTDEAFLKRIDYWYWDTYRKDVPELVHKSVDFYLLRMVGGRLSDSSYEVDGVGWFSFDEAQKILTFAGELEVVQLARNLLDGTGLPSNSSPNSIP